jgi:hypothetical protein
VGLPGCRRISWAYCLVVHLVVCSAFRCAASHLDGTHLRAVQRQIGGEVGVQDRRVSPQAEEDLAAQLIEPGWCRKATSEPWA